MILTSRVGQNICINYISLSIKGDHVEIIDTHAHLEGEEFADDLEQVVCRAQEA